MCFWHFWHHTKKHVQFNEKLRKPRFWPETFTNSPKKGCCSVCNGKFMQIMVFCSVKHQKCVRASFSAIRKNAKKSMRDFAKWYFLHKPWLNYYKSFVTTFSKQNILQKRQFWVFTKNICLRVCFTTICEKSKKSIRNFAKWYFYLKPSLTPQTYLVTNVAHVNFGKS